MTWPTDRQLDGGVDRIALPPTVPGSLDVCGKQAVATRYRSGDWDTVVCLTERHEIEAHYPDYVRWLSNAASDPASVRALWWPIPDLHAPPVDEMRELATEVADRLRVGERVLLHCAAGKGRAGTTVVCVLLELGASPDEAVQVVGRCRPGAGPEAGAQRELVRRYGGGA